MRPLLLLVTLTALPACGSASSNDLFSQSSSGCVIGSVAACVANSGCTGRKVCAADRSYGECTCASPGGDSGEGGEPGVGGAGQTDMSTAGEGGASGSGGTPSVEGSGGLIGAGGVVGVASASGAGGVGAGGSRGTGGVTDPPGSGGAIHGGSGGRPSSGGEPADSGIAGGSTPSDASVMDAPPSPPPCAAGTYTGALMGPYTAMMVTTQFVARLNYTVSMSGLVSGTLTGTSNPTSRATLTGTVDCGSGAASIEILDGSYWSGQGGPFSFSGDMTATFDFQTEAFSSGKWTITEPNSKSGGQGTWSVR